MSGLSIHEGRNKLLQKRWWVRLTAVGNNEPLMHSEAFTSLAAAEKNRAACRRAIEETT